LKEEIIRARPLLSKREFWIEWQKIILFSFVSFDISWIGRTVLILSFAREVPLADLIQYSEGRAKVRVQKSGF